MHPRLARELKTVAAMLRIHCAEKHGGERLCPDCADLLAYVEGRLAHCPFSGDKPPCKRCPVHCYQAGRRGQIQEVMRFAGPRMLRRHPYLALRHLIDGWLSSSL